MTEIRLEVNLDVVPNLDREMLILRIKWACNVYGVIKVQAVTELEPDPEDLAWQVELAERKAGWDPNP